ncbi:MAG: sulfatase-like hydrolase/transferase [Armatimonadetes bacterium]|nr:sulfatase-like hydrolase/transferase [Armatimonadota bacterium]
MTHHLNPKSGAHPFTLTEAPRPHLFLISVDMIPRESTDPESPLRAHLRTPNMDRLFADGIRFSHACSTSPLCGPSRAAYLTGRYAYLTVNEERAHDGWQTTLRPDDAIFPEYLKAAGYLTKHAGKGHIGTEKFLDAFGENDAPWNRWAPPLADDDAYLAYLKSLGLEPPVWHEPLVGLRPDGVTPGNSFGGWVRQENGGEFPFEGLYDTYLAELAARKLDAALRQRTPGQPLYLQLDFFGPHQPFMIPESFRERFAELLQIVELPDSYEEALSGVAPWPRVYEFYRRNWGLYDRDLARRYMAMNLLQVEVLDASLGRFLAALDAHGLYDEAAIVFTGDHGEMNTERALVDKGVYGHPKVALAPLAVKLPFGERAGEEGADLVSLLDIAPTVLGLAGIAPAERLDGVPLVAVGAPASSRHERCQHTCQQDAGAPTAGAPRDFIFEAGWHVCPNPAVALFADLAGRRFMYTYNLCDPRDELYDMDDRQYRDLSDDPALADVKLEMIRRLGAFLESDPRWTCYWHTFRLDKFEQLGRPGGDFQMYRPH